MYKRQVTDLSAVVDKGGLTALGQKQLALYLVFCGLLLILALAIGRRFRPPAQVQLPVEKRKLSRRTTAAAVSILLLIPVTLFVGVYYLNNQRYGLVSVLVLLECMAPFFLVFEGRRPQARELVVIAVLCAISVAGRAAFFMLPQFKPVMAMTIISGVALGGESGFLVGALSMLVSNMLFSQGVWTPWQMFCMGIIGFLAGVLFRKGLLRRTRGSLCTFGAFCAIMQPIHLAIGLIEGLITAAVLLFLYEARPELLRDVRMSGETTGKASFKGTIAVIAIAAVLVGGGLSLLASGNPDGLEWSLFGNSDAGYTQNMGLDEDSYGVQSSAADKAGTCLLYTSPSPRD